MKTVEQIKEKLEKEYDLYRITNDAKVLQNECYQRIQALEWVLEDSENE